MASGAQVRNVRPAPPTDIAGLSLLEILVTFVNWNFVSARRTDLVRAQRRRGGGGGPHPGGLRGGATMALADRTNLKEKTPDSTNGERENLW